MWFIFVKNGVPRSNFSTIKMYVDNNEIGSLEVSDMGLAVLTSKNVLFVLMLSYSLSKKGHFAVLNNSYLFCVPK